MNSVKSAVYHQASQSAIDRCETAAAKRVGARERPVGQQAAAAASGDAEALRVDVAAADDLVERGHEDLR